MTKINARTVSGAELDAIKERSESWQPSFNGSKKRIDWPFKRMNKNDTIAIDEFVEKHPYEIMSMAHNYGNYSGKKFSCKTIDGTLYIKRIK